jgi:beta-phosphoglucomutase family hydrolase
VRACLFDLDGVLTETATLHARAWKAVFDELLEERAHEEHTDFAPFDPVADYDAYVDGRPREEGVRAFLASRGIELPEGSDADPDGARTISALARDKDHRFLQLVHSEGVTVYPGSKRYLAAVEAAGLDKAVVSSSANCAEILEVAGIAEHFALRVDGVFIAEHHLAGKPAPDSFLAAARALGVPPAEAAVFEDALAGVEAGRRGGFGVVVGVDRVGQADELAAHGATIVVEDLGDLLAHQP